MHNGKSHALSSAARTGLVVVDPSCNLVASNAEAIQILTFPERPEKIAHLEDWVSNRIRSRLLDRRGASGSKFVPQFRSENRTYLCRCFPLSSNGKDLPPHTPALVLLLERNSNGMVTLREISERFGLTPREQETVGLLLEGLTSKEIAERMKISPNTVKAFIRLVMVKMDVSTRSGIIGKIAGSQDGASSGRGVVRLANSST
jgi:DNA-binding CsgD family transcriptional regulator